MLARRLIVCGGLLFSADFISFICVDCANLWLCLGLLEEKGVHHNPGPVAEESAKTTGEESKNATSTPTKEKVSLKDKIKAKLHKNKDKE